MTHDHDVAFENRLRRMLRGRAASVSASPDDAGLVAAVAAGRKRRQRRQWGAGLSAAAALIVGGSLLATGLGGGAHQTVRATRRGPAHRTVLVLPLSGTIDASGPLSKVRQHAVSGAASGVSANKAADEATSGPIDVAPSSSALLQRLFAHTSPDGVQVTVFEPSGSGSTAQTAPDQPEASSGSPAAFRGCLTTTPLTVEVSDFAAVGTYSEPLFSGASGAVVDVQIGEIGVAEGQPATWVLAQTGSGAASVRVQFADGAVDTAPVPTSGVVVLGHRGTPQSALGSGALASVSVLGGGGQILATYGLGVSTSPPTTGTGPTSLPPPGPTQPSDVAAATAAVTKALSTALGCTSSPLQRSLDVAGGVALEADPNLSGTGVVTVDHVVFTSATSAVAQYDLLVYGSGAETGPLYADATLTGSSWEVSLSSVAPGLQVTPPNQVGSVTVAPGGPLLVQRWPDGTAVGVYKALPGSQGASGYGTGDAACLPAGGIVEEITTPGAVKVLTAPLFPNYTSPLIGAAVSIVGAAEGAPATVVEVEAGSHATTLSVTSASGTATQPMVDGVAVVAEAGDPSSVLGAAGSQLSVNDASGAALETIPLQVDTAQPAGPSSLPSSLPAPGQGPADPQAATQAIDQAFASVFNCATPPIDRVQNIEDGSLVAGALEQLDTGPYEALASSSYITVDHVVFESPTLADVSYTLLFHSDAQLTFPMIGQALVVSGSWRVSYSTVCAAIQLGLGNCQT
jgi:hypothetical protein